MSAPGAPEPRPRIVAGSARSGTTWIVDVLAQANGAGTLFEPLNPEAVPDAAPIQNRLLLADDDAPQAHAFFSRLFAGAYRTPWTLGRVYPQELVPGAGTSLRQCAAKIKEGWTHYRRYGRSSSGTWLYKLIRANLMLQWLAAQFDARIALVVRHPGAVVASRLRRHWPWAPTLEAYLGDERVRSLLPAGTADALGAIADPVAGHGAIWVVQHLVAFQQWRTAPSFTVHFYEDLKRDDADEWRRLAATLALDALPSTALRHRPSQQADRGAFAPAPEVAGGRWRAAMTGDDLERLQYVLELSGLDSLYNAQSDAPLAAGADPFRAHTAT